MQKLNLGIDFDGVITDPTQMKIDWIKENCGIVLKPEQTVQPVAAPIIGKEAYKALIAETYAGDLSMRNRIRPEAVSGLNYLLAQGHKVFIITSRTEKEFAMAHRLIERDKVPYTAFHNTNDQPKVDICRQCKVDLFLDDSKSKLEPLQEIPGITLVFFNCFQEKKDHRFEEVVDWDEFIAMVDSLA